MNKKYSVLMSVYYKENPEYLLNSMESMLNQTVVTNDFVLVCDGPLTDELNKVISKEKRKYKEILNVVRLKENKGLGNALNEGLKHCKNELVARMDSDDISHLDRCEKQLMIFDEYPGISICSGYIEEFYDDVKNIQTIRKLPITNTEIVKISKYKNPFNHMTVMFKKSSVNICGNYQSFYLLEDYYLWIRMLSKGYTARNIDDILVSVRTGNNMYKRRGGLDYAKSQIKLYKYMLDINWIKKYEYFINSCARFILSILPNYFRKFIFEHILREKVE